MTGYNGTSGIISSPGGNIATPIIEQQITEAPDIEPNISTPPTVGNELTAPTPIELANNEANPDVVNPRTFLLKREMYSNLGVTDMINRRFEEFARPSVDIDLKSFGNTYEELFYDIPREGEVSHRSIAQRSLAYLDDQVDTKDNQINQLLDQIEAYEDEKIARLQTQEHPFFPDGTILHVPHTYTGIMQGGKARKMEWQVWEILRQQPQFRDGEGNVKSIHDVGVVFEDMNVINGIPTGDYINKVEDLNDYIFEVPLPFQDYYQVRSSLEQLTLNEAQYYIIQRILEEKMESGQVAVASEEEEKAALQVTEGGLGMAVGGAVQSNLAEILENQLGNLITTQDPTPPPVQKSISSVVSSNLSEGGGKGSLNIGSY